MVERYTNLNNEPTEMCPLRFCHFNPVSQILRFDGCNLLLGFSSMGKKICFYTIWKLQGCGRGCWMCTLKGLWQWRQGRFFQFKENVIMWSAATLVLFIHLSDLTNSQMFSAWNRLVDKILQYMKLCVSFTFSLNLDGVISNSKNTSLSFIIHQLVSSAFAHCYVKS